MAKPKMQMIVEKQEVVPEYINVEFISDYGGTHTLYLNGTSIAISKGKATVTQSTKKILMDNGYIK